MMMMMMMIIIIIMIKGIKITIIMIMEKGSEKVWNLTLYFRNYKFHRLYFLVKELIVAL